MRAASSNTRPRGQRSPSIALAITTPAVSAAALDPNPLPSGIWLSISSSIGGMVRSRSAAIRTAVCQIRLSSPLEIERRVAPAHANAQLVRRAKPALQINAQSQPQRVESGTEIGAGCGNSQFAEGQTAILTRSPPIRLELQV